MEKEQEVEGDKHESTNYFWTCRERKVAAHSA